MKPNFFPENARIFEEKGEIPYWIIASKAGVHLNTIRNWMKSKMSQEQKKIILAAIKDAKQELAKDQ